MGKKKKTGLGRTLVKAKQKKLQEQYFQSNRHSSEASLNDNTVQKMQSIIETNDLNEFMNIAILQNREFAAERETVTIVVDEVPKVFNLDSADGSLRETTAAQSVQLPIPRRPQWDSDMSAAQLHDLEKESFLKWRRSLVSSETHVSMSVTPYEKNLNVWRQLWRTIERSHLVVQIVDARNPLAFRSTDLEQYVRELNHANTSNSQLNKDSYPTSGSNSQLKSHSYLTSGSNPQLKSHSYPVNTSNSQLKVNVLLVNKADLLTRKQRFKWASYFKNNDIKAIFFSAALAQQELDDSQDEIPTVDDMDVSNFVLPDKEDVTHIYTREELLCYFKSSILLNDKKKQQDDDNNEKQDDGNNREKQQVDNSREKQDNKKKQDDNRKDVAVSLEQQQQQLERPARNTMEKSGMKPSETNKPNLKAKQGSYNNTGQSHGKTGQPHGKAGQSHEEIDLGNGLPNEIPHVVVGMVGYPNVGKSSVVNVLCGHKRVAVGATPGKTKHLQTLFIGKNVILCDCPGLVFPSASTTKDDMVCDGILPIDQMREHRGPIALLCQRIPYHVFELLYGFKLPKERSRDVDSPPLGVEELLYTFARSKSMMSQKGVPNAPAAARILLKDYVNGRLLYCHPPPKLLQHHNASLPPEHNASLPLDHNASLPPEHSASLLLDHNASLPPEHSASLLLDHNASLPLDHQMHHSTNTHHEQEIRPIVEQKHQQVSDMEQQADSDGDGDDDYFTESEEEDEDDDRKDDNYEKRMEKHKSDDNYETEHPDLFVEGAGQEEQSKRQTVRQVKFNDENVHSAALELKRLQNEKKHKYHQEPQTNKPSHYFYDPMAQESIEAGIAKGEHPVHSTLSSSKQEKIIELLSQTVSTREEAIDKMRQRHGDLSKEEQQQLKALKRRFVYMKKFI